MKDKFVNNTLKIMLILCICVFMYAIYIRSTVAGLFYQKQKDNYMDFRLKFS